MLDLLGDETREKKSFPLGWGGGVIGVTNIWALGQEQVDVPCLWMFGASLKMFSQLI